MRSLSWVLALGLSGCWGPASDTPVAEGPAPVAAESLPAAASPPAPGGAAVAAAGGAAAACEAIAAAMRGVPGTEVTRSDGAFEDRVGGRLRTGCRVAVKGTFRALEGAQRPETTIAEALQGRGLTPDNRYDADGPDGTSFALRADAILCVVQGRWDGGDAEDPSYVPADWYELVAGCTPVAP